MLRATSLPAAGALRCASYASRVATHAVIGNVNVDVVVWPAREVPPPGVERSVERIDLRVGGAAAVAGATLARLGRDPVVAGCVGQDALGTTAIDELERYGVGTEHIVRVGSSPTGACVAFEAPSFDRSFLMSLGCLATYRASMVGDEAISSSFVLLCGYFNLPGLRGEPTARLLRRVKDAGGTTLLDTGSDHDGWPSTTCDEVRSLLPLVDVFVPNELEAAHLAGEPDAVAAARALTALSGGWTVVKLGRQGSVAAGPDGTVHRAVAPHVEVVDTTGAGDAFNAGLMSAVGEGRPWPDALRTASAVASTVVSRPSGDRYPTPDDLLDPVG